MRKPKLKMFTEVSDVMYGSKKYSHISLSDGPYSLPVIYIFRDGTIKIATSSRSGHGEGLVSHPGMTMNKWLEYLKEAQGVWAYYYG